MQFFHPAFRHLWYLTGLALVGLVVLGYAYEKLNGDTTGLAILGFTASIVHATAFWFTIGPASPLKKFFVCLILFVGAMGCAFAGRSAYQLVADQPTQPLLESMKFIASVIPAWWLSLAIINGLLKEILRWRLNYANSPISPRTSLSDIFQLTAIVGVVIAFANPTVSSLVKTEYSSILIVSLLLNLVVILPLSLLVLKGNMAAPTWTIFKVITVAALAVLGLLAVSQMVTDAIEDVANAAVGVITLTAPYFLMLLMTRENMISLSSGWFIQEETIELD